MTKLIAALAFTCAVYVHGEGFRNQSIPVIMEHLQFQEGFLECAKAPKLPGDRRFDHSKLSYATFNVEFLFLQGLGQLKCPGSDCKWKDMNMAEKHLQQIAQDIIDLDVDILQLNEVEDCNVLNALVGKLAAMGDSSYRPYLVRGRDTFTSQNAALLTRVDPVTDLQRYDQSVQLPVPGSTCPRSGRFAEEVTSEEMLDREMEFGEKIMTSLRGPGGYEKSKSLSKHFYTTFRVEGFVKPITIVGAHFLARPDDKRRCPDREGQAYIVSQIAQEALAKGHHVIISGDMNDFDGQVLDRNSKRPISNVMGIMTGSSFMNVASQIPQPARYTHWWDRNRDCVYEMHEVSSLDHVLVSKDLERKIDSVVFGHQLFQQSCKGYGSDHYPIMVTLRGGKQ